MEGSHDPNSETRKPSGQDCQPFPIVLGGESISLAQRAFNPRAERPASNIEIAFVHSAVIFHWETHSMCIQFQLFEVFDVSPRPTFRLGGAKECVGSEYADELK